MNCQHYSGWPLAKRKPGVISDGEGLVEAPGECIEVGCVGLYWGVGIGAREGDSSSVVNLYDETFLEEAIGLSEGSSSYVWEGGGYALSKGVGSGVGSGRGATSGGQGEGQQGFQLLVPISRYLGSRGYFRSFLSISRAVAGR